MRYYGIPTKFITIIQSLYEDATCQVIHDGKLTEPFNVQTGVRQGCLLSPTIFLIVIDWVMRQATKNQRTGIQWTLMRQLEDLDFADDISLLSHKLDDAQKKLCRVAEEAEKTGLQINISKTEVMRVNSKQQNPIRLHEEDIKEANKFTYLGSIVNKDGGSHEDIKCRINKARHAFITLRQIWKSKTLSIHKKLRIFNTNIKSVLLYGSETWRVTKTNSKKTQGFTNRCLRNILGIHWPEVISNEELWEKTRQTPVETEIMKRKWGWIGHTLRKPASNITRQALDWNPQGKRKDLGVPRKRKKRRLRQLGEAAERASNSIWKWSHFKEWGSGRCEPLSSGGKSCWGSQGGQYYQYPPKLCDLPWSVAHDGDRGLQEWTNMLLDHHRLTRLVAHDGDRGLQEWTDMLLDHHRKTRLVQVYVLSMLKSGNSRIFHPLPGNVPLAARLRLNKKYGRPRHPTSGKRSNS
ncbi:hypothetical protein EGW08_023439 [Elysia chlorotica]|uniref:Reverse transcriptase domain-containing protein n=1 Tax=Elysia chlorotica TaxID=188477 RepID=A0A3S0Z7Q3_ELYCH|nr:hypothetical protein EGW08_023439 [Elysia chlorotica]